VVGDTVNLSEIRMTLLNFVWEFLGEGFDVGKYRKK